MRSPEEIHASLQALKNPNYDQDQFNRVWAVWGNVSNLGQILIQAGPAWKKVAKHADKLQKAQIEAGNQLGELKPGDRRKLFKALHPQLAPELEAAWNLFDRLPYQSTYYRRPFRTQGHLTSSARGLWLQRLLQAVKGYDQPADWFAAWAPHLGYWAPDALGYLFAGAIEAGGESGQRVFDILIASGEGRHEIGLMGRHVVRGLACASRPDGWEFIERLLLSAQREEGLRQVVLESVDEAHPQLFRRMLHLILGHRLTRFSAAVRAFDVWFGLALETVSQKTITDLLEGVLYFLDDPQSCQAALLDGPPEKAYYALWAMAFNDAQSALPHAIALRRSPDIQRRFIATHLLAQMDLWESFRELLEALEDPELSVVARAVAGLASHQIDPGKLGESDLFELLEGLIPRLPHKTNTLKAPVWDWLPLTLERDKLAGMLVTCLGKRSHNCLHPYLSIMDPDGRARVARLLAESGAKDAETRQMLFALAGDPSSYVRSSALQALHGFNLSEVETVQLEGLLTRQAADLRRGVIQLILELPDSEVLKSATRLLESKVERQRMAGLELLRECIHAQRLPGECRRLAAAYQARAGQLESEAAILDDILADDVQTYSLEDALGLMDPDKRTPARPPRSGLGKLVSPARVKLGSQAAIEILKSLDALVEEYRSEPVELTVWETTRTELLGNVQYGFPHPDPSQPLEADLERLPLRQVWQDWYRTRPDTLRDSDGFELYRAAAIMQLFHRSYDGFSKWNCEVHKSLQGFLDVRIDFKLNYEPILSHLVVWLFRSHLVEDEVPFLLDALEISTSRIPKAELVGVSEMRYFGANDRILQPQRLAYLNLCRWQRAFRSETWRDEHHARLWAVVRWLDEPKPGLSRYHPDLEDAFYAWRAGAATRDDILDLLLGGHPAEHHRNRFHALRELSGRKPHPLLKTFPEVQPLVEACRERILSIETRRGDLPTSATGPALVLRSVPGMANLFRLLAALGKTSFDRGWHWGETRQSVLSGLIRITYPLESDTPQGFAELVKNYRITERRLVELAVYAPQWSALVEFSLGWPKFKEAVFWLYAHTKDRQWYVEKEIHELWASQVSEYTPLSTERLMDGAADAAWFHQVYQALGKQRWKEVYRCAELTASGNGHVRARLFADAMLGRVTAEALIERFTQKRHQDSVRALGLVPLPSGADSKAEVLRRYEAMQEFIRTSKKYGSQRQASEKLAAAIGMENLARTAGYVDPQRLEWAMEVKAIGDLASGTVVVEANEVRLSLSIDELGEPLLEISKNGKHLKSIPARVKKEPQVADLVNRKQALQRQASRMRQSLEQAMCRGDDFSGTEINQLFRHPILRSMLEQLVFTGLDGMGYLWTDGENMKLLHPSGLNLPVRAGDRLRIAHPVDLLESGEWHLWQRDCFLSERIQPFKQVFRELYLLAPTEAEAGHLSRRYAGQQVNPRQALALFGKRGWVTAPEEGVHKTFHDQGISARVGFLQAGYTPAEMEGLTLEEVLFTPRGEWRPLPLQEIEPRLFSEVMRDLDLVVSVAHAGGVDPEASASSIEARTALLRETCALLGLDNVRLSNKHALIDGQLGNYSVHLGSAVVHKQPGGALCIIPVHSQQRGRLFLPFIDNDPKSAEVVSKVIALARDSEIRDPTILEQIL
jgi:HEAT repeat protein